MTTLDKFLSSINTSSLAGRTFARVPNTNSTRCLLDIFYSEGLIYSYHWYDARVLVVHLKYCFGSPLFKRVSRVSKPSRRKYFPLSQIKRKYGPYTSSMLVVFSTSKGMITAQDAIRYGVGGECLFEVSYF